MDTDTLEISASTENRKGKASDNWASSGSGLLTVGEAAHYIHPTMKASTVNQLIRNKQISPIKIGRFYYIHKNEIERFLKKCQGEKSQQDYSNEEMTARGSSLTGESISGQDMVTDFLKRQKKN